MKTVAASRGVQVTCALPDAPVSVHGDADRIQQVLTNLLSNAIKFSEADGNVHVSLTTSADRATVAVRDAGRGIQPEFLPKIFDAFSQENQSPTCTTGGLGLGLAIVRHLVRAHGGRVIAESGGLGLGATFRVELPMVA